jgi:hypothetical protein
MTFFVYQDRSLDGNERGLGCLKLTFLNPCTTHDQVATLLRLIATRGREMEAYVAPRQVAVEAA